MRSAVRFPIQLPVAIHSNSGTCQATTTDISAGGVLFHSEAPLAVGSTIEFTINMPGSVVGASTDVLVNCVGRVVRCSEEISGPADVAAVIDDYAFERR
ncbi:MAG TPA: PilZ domain-containing protein [Candidatus Koribacter sp.]